ncbi:hypothetical protein LTR08_001534 [Meristemomyces frigidus]|nr:hypothetical protein LTR08_001534 [Meristemomyces frigidus]
MLPQILLGLAMAGLSTAHFVLNWPPTAGFVDEGESSAPCGSAIVMVNSSSPNVQVDRFAVQILSTHPAGEWMFRATTSTEEPYTWTDMTPVVNTTGAGNFCLDDMHAPSSFAGKPGIIQVVDKSVDGALYQCAPVNFVTGANSTLGSTCANATGITAVWTSLQNFDGTTDASSSSSTTASVESASVTSGGGSGASSVAAATSAAGAALFTGVGSVLGGLGLLAAGLAL